MLLREILFGQRFETFVFAELVLVVEKLQHVQDLFHLNVGVAIGVRVTTLASFFHLLLKFEL